MDRQVARAARVKPVDVAVVAVTSQEAVMEMCCLAGANPFGPDLTSVT